MALYFLLLHSRKTSFFKCLTVNSFFSQVAYPYVAKRLLTDPNPALRERLIQVGFTYSLESIVLKIYEQNTCALSIFIKTIFSKCGT